MSNSHALSIKEFRDAGHALVDRLADYLENVESKPVFPEVDSAYLESLFEEGVPKESMPIDQVLREVEEKILPYCTHVNHPGYLGLITPSPTPTGILGDFIASTLNQNIGAYTIGPSAVSVERRVIRWLNELVGFDHKAGGNLTSGGMMANFIGLKLARDWATGDTAQQDGMTQPYAMYVSEERHISIDKAADAIGIGRNFLRKLPTDEKFSIRIDALEAALKEDKAQGIKPMCIIALAGTTNTGSIDDLMTLSKNCRPGTSVDACRCSLWWWRAHLP
jgi:glutamate/tyrosine decarboxylase-like PLP-dependent enzyme